MRTIGVLILVRSEGPNRVWQKPLGGNTADHGGMTHGQTQLKEAGAKGIVRHGMRATTPHHGLGDGRHNSGTDHQHAQHIRQDTTMPWHGGKIAPEQRMIEPGKWI